MQKKKRLVNDKLRKLVASDPCVCCGATPSVCAHVRSVGAGGPDCWQNLIPLCVRHHTHGNDAQHVHGWKHIYDKFKGLREALYERGWELDGVKLVRMYSIDEEFYGEEE